MLTYTQATDFLFNRLAAFHRKGAAAYKPGLDTTLQLSELFGNPHTRLRVIHVGGTNGKGSVTHTVAAVLQSQGYKVGLYTSPHLVDFAERIRVNGEPISHEYVTDFVCRYQAMQTDADPSFFELSTVMAFEYFDRCGVDFAVVEVGMGGRLDSTNIVNPVVTAVTNISLDHTGILGDTRAGIAAEKAGIFKPGVPAVIGESDAEVMPVFVNAAKQKGVPLTFAEMSPMYAESRHRNGYTEYLGTPWGDLKSPLTGECQPHNALTAMAIVKQLIYSGVSITADAVHKGFEQVTALTGLMGRWQTIRRNPRVIVDTGHNIGAWTYLSESLRHIADTGNLHIVLGFVADKDLHEKLPILPHNATYHFTQPSTPRALPVADLAGAAARAGIQGSVHTDVASAYTAATADNPDTVFVGGSTFVVADLLETLRTCSLGPVQQEGPVQH